MMTRNVVALYDNLSDAQKALGDLVQAGVKRENISLVANDAAGDYEKFRTSTSTADVNANEGHAGPVGGSLFGAVVGAVVGLGAVLIPGIGPVIAAGPLIGAAGAVAGAIIGGTTGGITGGLLGLGVPQEEVHYYAEGIRRGGTLVTATVDEGMVPTVESVFDRYSPVDIQRRATAWRQSGWTGFNENAAPYTTSEIARDREAYTNSDASETSTNQTSSVPTTTGTSRRVRIYNREDNSAHV